QFDFGAMDCLSQIPALPGASLDQLPPEALDEAAEPPAALAVAPPATQLAASAVPLAAVPAAPQIVALAAPPPAAFAAPLDAPIDEDFAEFIRICGIKMKAERLASIQELAFELLRKYYSKNN